MKYYMVLMFFAVLVLTGCNQLERNEINERDCLVSFNLIGDITTVETPMTKATTDDLYLVQVYRGSNPFAFGIFDDVSNIKFNLKKGSESYRIIVSMIKEGKKINTYNNLLYGGGSSSRCSYTILYYSSAYYVINTIYYNSVGGVTVYWNVNRTSSSVLGKDNYIGFENIGKAVVNGEQYPMCADWLYGEINNYSPTGEYETLNVDLKRVGFKLKYELSGVTDGEVTVKVFNNIRTFIENTTNTSTFSGEPVFFAFYDAHSAWQYADDYMENFTLSVSWLRGIGITEDYGTKTIQLKRNCLNNIKINLGSNDQSAGMNLTVESESSIGSENVTIPVE